MSKGKYPFRNSTKKNPGRAQRRQIATLSLRKGYGSQSPFLYKFTNKRKKHKNSY